MLLFIIDGKFGISFNEIDFLLPAWIEKINKYLYLKFGYCILFLYEGQFAFKSNSTMWKKNISLIIIYVILSYKNTYLLIMFIIN